VRRAVSITLLLLISLPLISPLLAESVGSSALPACCRKGGMHHCTLPAMADSSSSNTTPHFSVIHERCPYSPATVQTTIHGNALFYNDNATTLTPHDNIALRIAQEEAHYRISFDRSRQKRGPPSQSPSL